MAGIRRCSKLPCGLEGNCATAVRSLLQLPSSPSPWDYWPRAEDCRKRVWAFFALEVEQGSNPCRAFFPFSKTKPKPNPLTLETERIQRRRPSASALQSPSTVSLWGQKPFWGTWSSHLHPCRVKPDEEREPEQGTGPRSNTGVRVWKAFSQHGSETSFWVTLGHFQSHLEMGKEVGRRKKIPTLYLTLPLRLTTSLGARNRKPFPHLTPLPCRRKAVLERGIEVGQLWILGMSLRKSDRCLILKTPITYVSHFANPQARRTLIDDPAFEVLSSRSQERL